jgi:hypothetical protein
VTPLLTDVELLALAVASKALNGIDPGERDTHREAASDYIRGQLAPRYSALKDESLTDQDVSFELKQAIASVAAYHLMGRRGFNPTKGSEAQIQARYDVTMKWLEQIKTYKAELVAGGIVDRGGPLVAGTGDSVWTDWRSGGPS